MFDAVAYDFLLWNRQGRMSFHDHYSKFLFKDNTSQMIVGSFDGDPPMLKSDIARMKRDDEICI